MIVGYARVSTDEQKLDLQMRALEDAGCNSIFTDHGLSGYSFQRGGLTAALNCLTPGGTLIVWRLDRLGRSLASLVNLMELLAKRDIHFRSLCENIDTNSSGGKLMFHMMAALAEFERSLISERTRAGMAAAKANGRALGRPKALTDVQIVHAKHHVYIMNTPISQVAAELQVSRRTLCRHLDKHSKDTVNLSA